MPLRYSSISQDPAAAAQQGGANARDANLAFDEKVSGRLVKVERYAAWGDTTKKIYLRPGARRPEAVLLVRAYATFDPGTDITVTSRPNFYHDAIGIGVYEPSGLVADTQYNLTFLLLE
jgi:hypothetical protein